MAGGNLICAIDAGTSGVKVGLVDEQGRLVRGAHRPHTIAHPRAGWVEQSVEQLWQAECTALHELLDGVEPNRLAAVACSSQRATMISLGEKGEAITDFIGWQDHRGLPQCALIEKTIGAERYFAITGLSIEPVASVSKILWLLEHRPEIAARTRCFATHQTMLLRQLGVDAFICSPSEASYVGLFDVSERAWSQELTQAFGIDSRKLPEIAETTTVVGSVSAEASTATGLAAGLPIVMAGGDLQLGALGNGAGAEGMVAVGIGTGGGSVACVSSPRLDPKRRVNCLCHVVPGGWELEGLGRAAGGTFRWFRDILGEAETTEAFQSGRTAYDHLTDRAATVPPGSNGLLVIPAWAGLGAPLNDAAFSGTILGLRLEHSKDDIVRAFMEGITLEQRMILEAGTELWGDVDEIRIWGGGAKSELWCQMFADICARPVLRMVEQDASLIGAAICGAVGAGLVSSVQDGARTMVRTDRLWQPNPAAVLVYERYYQAYSEVIMMLRSSGVSGIVAGLADSEAERHDALSKENA